MISSEIIIICTGIYLLLLFYIAYRGDKQPSQLVSRYQALIYTLSLTVYCTSWTFYGAVGNAAQDGLSFFAIYLGPILVFVFLTPFLRKLVKISQRQKTTTIADFIATRYGKSHQVTAPRQRNRKIENVTTQQGGIPRAIGLNLCCKEKQNEVEGISF